MDLDLTCVHSWLVLVQEQHFGRAAPRLNLTPSALTKRIQRLERQVGVPLVVRNPGAASSPRPRDIASVSRQPACSTRQSLLA